MSFCQDLSSLSLVLFFRLARSAGSAIGFMPDDSRGTKEVFRIEDLAMVPMPEAAEGMLFGGDSYVIKYSYEKDGRPGYIVYFWQVYYNWRELILGAMPSSQWS